MNTNGHESPQQLLQGELMYSIVGCALDVLNGLGHGLTGHQVGLIINFSKPKLEWERMVL